MSFPRYPQYKDSGVEWLGQVPGHWETKPIKAVCQLFGRIGYRGYTIADIVNEGEGAITLSPSNMADGVVSVEKCTYISWEKYTESPEIMLQPGDIVMVKTGSTFGKVAYVSKVKLPTTINPQLVLFKGITCDSRFLFFILNADHISALIDVNNTGSSIPTMTQESIGNFGFGLPPRPEQTQIAAFLDRETAKIDDLVAQQRRLMELLKEKRQAVISHAVTKGLNPQAPMKPSGIEWLGDVPAHWEVIALKRIADIQTGVAKGKDHGTRSTVLVPYLRVANVQDGYLDLETIASMEIPSESLAQYALKVGDVLMNEGGDFDKLGRGHIWDGQIEPCITQNHVYAVRPKKVTSVWLNTITSSNFAQFYFMTQSKQSTNLASISSTNLMELPVLMPPIQEQQEILLFIAKTTSQFDTLATEAQRAIDLLQERRTALISAAVTGQIDVRRITF